jgi:hypothetical protein
MTSRLLIAAPSGQLINPSLICYNTPQTYTTLAKSGCPTNEQASRFLIMSSIKRTLRRRKARQNLKRAHEHVGKQRPLTPRDIQLMVSRNRLTAGRLKSMTIPELNMTANVLKAIYDASQKVDEREAIKTTVGYIFQVARDKAGAAGASEAASGD